MDNVFDIVLEKDEQIIEMFKPNKFKLFFKSIFAWTLVLFSFLIPLALGMFDVEGGMDFNKQTAVYLLIPIGIFVICEVVYILFLNMYYKKTVYAYTNKRLLIRTGVIGVDYKSLDLKSVGAMDVYVSLFDKLLRKNTGTLRFGSMSSPMNSSASFYQFAHIEKPYEVYKNIKEYKGTLD